MICFEDINKIKDVILNDQSNLVRTIPLNDDESHS